MAARYTLTGLESPPRAAPPQFKKSVKKRSWVWDWIEQDPENKYRAACIYCREDIFRLDGDRGSPKKLMTHVTSRHGITQNNFNSPEMSKIRTEKLKAFAAGNELSSNLQIKPLEDALVDVARLDNTTSITGSEDDGARYSKHRKRSSESMSGNEFDDRHRGRQRMSRSSHPDNGVNTGDGKMSELNDVRKEFSTRSTVALQKPATETRRDHKQSRSFQSSYQESAGRSMVTNQEYDIPLMTNYSLARPKSTVFSETPGNPEMSPLIDPSVSEAELRTAAEQRARREYQIEQYNDTIYAHNIQAEEFNKNVHLHQIKGLKLKHMRYVLTGSSINSIQLALADFIGENYASFKDLLFIESDSFRKLVKTIQDHPQQSV